MTIEELKQWKRHARVFRDNMPLDWEGFIEGLRAHAAEHVDACSTAPTEEVVRQQGRAQCLKALCSTLYDLDEKPPAPKQP